jgi:hypothetical protein
MPGDVKPPDLTILVDRGTNSQKAIKRQKHTSCSALFRDGRQRQEGSNSFLDLSTGRGL